MSSPRRAGIIFDMKAFLQPRLNGHVPVPAEKRFPDLTLEILGDGEYRVALEQLTESLGLSDRVRFFGYVPIGTVVERILEADVCVVSLTKDIFTDSNPESGTQVCRLTRT